MHCHTVDQETPTVFWNFTVYLGTVCINRFPCLTANFSIFFKSFINPIDGVYNLSIVFLRMQLINFPCHSHIV